MKKRSRIDACSVYLKEWLEGWMVQGVLDEGQGVEVMHVYLEERLEGWMVQEVLDEGERVEEMPVYLEEWLEGWMVQGVLDEGQRVEVEELLVVSQQVLFRLEEFPNLNTEGLLKIP